MKIVFEMKEIDKRLDSLINESVNEVLQETSWQTARAAYRKATDLSNDLIMNAYDSFEVSSKELSNFLDDSIQGQRLNSELLSLMSKIKHYCERKRKQVDSLHNHAIDSFEKRFGASHSKVAAHMNSLEDKYGDDFHNASWREKNLNDKERELYDYEGWR